MIALGTGRMEIGIGIGRRQFISVLGGAALAWPFATHAQQPAMPVVGFLGSGSLAAFASFVAGVRQGLDEAGFIDGQTVTIEYRWAEGQYDKLPGLVSELVSRPVSVLMAGGAPAAQAAKTATATIPVVFVAGFDPVQAGLVASLNRPGGNATGIAFIATELAPKRLQLVRDLLPKAAVVAMLANPTTPDAAQEVRLVQATAQAAGLQLRILNVSSLSNIESAFASFVEQRPDVVMVGVDPFMFSKRNEIIAFVMRSGIPAVFPFREYSEVGGLISYGTDIVSAYRQGGNYVGRILKGEKPADLPVQQSTKFELIINLKTAKAISLTIPHSLLVLADEVIE